MEEFKLSDNSTLKYKKNFINITDEEWDDLIKDCPKEKQEFIFMGKKIKMPRFQQAYGKSYNFSGITTKAIPFTPFILKIKNQINKLYPKNNFNNCLVNWYLTGDNYISFHSDNEKQLIKKSPIIGITFCKDKPRKLRIKENKKKKTIIDIITSNCSFYSMEGNFQNEFLHGVPKQKKSGIRVSLTFRCFK